MSMLCKFLLNFSAHLSRLCIARFYVSYRDLASCRFSKPLPSGCSFIAHSPQTTVKLEDWRPSLNPVSNSFSSVELWILGIDLNSVQ